MTWQETADRLRLFCAHASSSYVRVEETPALINAVVRGRVIRAREQPAAAVQVRARRQWRWAFAVAAVIALTDLLTKELVEARFAYGEGVAVTNFFNLVFVLNPGAAFSFLADAGGWQRPLLLGLGLMVSAVVAVMLVRNPMTRLAACGFAAVLGGALGNVVDRARHDAVVDWLAFHFASWHWPAFNVADISLTVGVAALLLDAMFAAHAGQAKPPT